MIEISIAWVVTYKVALRSLSFPSKKLGEELNIGSVVSTNVDWAVEASLEAEKSAAVLQLIFLLFLLHSTFRLSAEFEFRDRSNLTEVLLCIYGSFM